MAREEERWCFFNGANRQRGPTRILLLLLCTLLIGSLAHDDSYYNYASLEGKSLWDQQSLNIELTDVTDVARIRRATQPMVTTEQKDESLKDQPSSQPQQQAPTVESIHPANTSAVTYSTTYSTSEATSTSFAPNPKPIKKVPLQTDQDDDMSRVHVWANQTRNNTSKEQQPVDAKNNQTTVPSLTTLPTDTVTPQTIGVDETNTTDDIGDNISISKFPDNNTKVMTDNHLYYNSTFFSASDVCKKYWVDMDSHPDLRINHLLSQSHRRAATIKLKFDFPFYGHKVRNITIATGGFLYTGEYVHSWLAATQYIAPLMANFDTRLSNASYVKYADNGTAFTVEWEKVVLQDKPEAGSFTFQVTLHQNGDIVFVYSDIPMKIDHIEDTAHPVKVGVSDAYIMDRTVFFVRRKTIYEYHRVTFDQTHGINNCTTIYLKALPTCLSQENCRDCVTKVPTFECKWCPELNQCSTGTSRQRQDWLLKGCDTHNIKELKNCSAQITAYKGDEYDHDGRVHLEESITANEMNAKQERPGTSPLESTNKSFNPPSNMNMGVSGIIGILTVVALVIGLAGWGAYAYRNPHSTSGQMLIRYRPSQWSWRRGEARYTAATIHM